MINDTVLFIPVSSQKGIGEYMRSTIIASHLQSTYPDLNIEFVLNENAPYVSSCAFKTHLVPQSPTRCVEQVNNIINAVKPKVVVFDASGRAQQFKFASEQGAKVVFLSQHARKRAKGLSLGKIRYTSSHLVAQPSFTMPDLTWWQKAKLWLFNKPNPTHLGCVFLPSSHEEETAVLSQYDLTSKNYILLSAGSGGHKLEQDWAADGFAKVASHLADKYKKTCLVIYGASYPNPVPESQGQVINIHAIENSAYIALLKHAQVAVLSGGGSLLQAISLQVPSVSTSVAKDQPHRIAACADLRLTLAAEPTIADVKQKAEQLMDIGVQSEVIQKLQQQGLGNGVEIAVNEINNLLSQMG